MFVSLGVRATSGSEAKTSDLCASCFSFLFLPKFLLYFAVFLCDKELIIQSNENEDGETTGVATPSV